MPLWIHIVYVIASLVLLWKGCDWLVESAVKIAAWLGISQLVIGLTVVALGTSAPEFVVTIGAALQGQSNISVSNVIGSNVFNLGFILGGIALIRAIESSKKIIWRDGMVLLGATIAVMIMLWDYHLSHLEGILLFLAFIGYNLFLFFEKRTVPTETYSTSSKMLDGAVLLVGIFMIIVGGYLLRVGAVGIARILSVPNWVIGTTVIAAGTSVPEFAASSVASFKGHHKISAGNLIGSCIYNLMGVLGFAGLIRPMDVSANSQTSMVLLLGLVVLSLLLLRTRHRLSRWEGIVLFLTGVFIWIIEFA